MPLLLTLVSFLVTVMSTCSAYYCSVYYLELQVQTPTHLLISMWSVLSTLSVKVTMMLGFGTMFTKNLHPGSPQGETDGYFH